MQQAQVPPSMDKMLHALGLYTKHLEDCSRKAEFAVDNIWHHSGPEYFGRGTLTVKVSPSLSDAAMGKLAQGARLLTEGGQKRVFQQNFGKFEGEMLLKSFACHHSTPLGPVMGTLYVSSKRLAFCSDFPLPNYSSPTQPQSFFYKVVVMVEEMASANPSSNRLNPMEKYIQVVTKDGHQLWFMGFVSYDKALACLAQLSHGSFNSI